MKDKEIFQNIVGKGYMAVFSTDQSPKINDELESARYITTINYDKYKKDKKAYEVAIQEHVAAFFEYIKVTKNNNGRQGNLLNFSNTKLIEDLRNNCLLLSDGNNIVAVNVVIKNKAVKGLTSLSRSTSKKLLTLAEQYEDKDELDAAIEKDSKLHKKMINSVNLPKYKIDQVIIEFISVI